MSLLAPCLVSALLFCFQAAPAQTSAESIDWTEARRLFQMEQRGQALTEEEAAYLAKAKDARRAGGGRRPARGKGSGGAQRPAPETMTPLSDLSAEDRYEGEEGGLYGAGRNEAPAELEAAAREALAAIRPLDAEGRPADAGKIVLVSISMSNATQEFSVFKRMADSDERKSEQLAIVDCAQGGQAMAEWVPPEGRPWSVAISRLEGAGVSPQQVQVAWIKLANKAPSGSMEEHLGKLEADTVEVIRNARARFPNLRIAYLGSRIWAGNARGGLNPEPYAYESAFAVRNLIRRQMDGDESLARGEAPVLLWGPYLWAAGEAGRKSDGLKYLPSDFVADGVHPSDSGREKVAKQLLEFFSTNPLATDWFLR